MVNNRKTDSLKKDDMLYFITMLLVSRREVPEKILTYDYPRIETMKFNRIRE